MFTLQLFAYPLTGLVTVFALAIYLGMAIAVGRARSRYNVQPPHLDGPPEFMRIVRIHLNTLEQITLFLPLLWLAAGLWGDRTAAIIGVVWPLARLLFAWGYARSVAQRLPGFIIGALVVLGLMVADGVGLILTLAS